MLYAGFKRSSWEKNDNTIRNNESTVCGAGVTVVNVVMHTRSDNLWGKSSFSRFVLRAPRHRGVLVLAWAKGHRGLQFSTCYDAYKLE